MILSCFVYFLYSRFTIIQFRCEKTPYLCQSDYPTYRYKDVRRHLTNPTCRKWCHPITQATGEQDRVNLSVVLLYWHKRRVVLLAKQSPARIYLLFCYIYFDKIKQKKTSSHQRGLNPGHLACNHQCKLLAPSRTGWLYCFFKWLTIKSVVSWLQ